MVREESELAGGAVVERVLVIRRYGEKRVVAGIDADSVGHLPGEPRFQHVVALNTQHLEIDAHSISEPIFVTGRKIPVDPSANLVAFGVHLYQLCHVETSVGVNLDLAIV